VTISKHRPLSVQPQLAPPGHVDLICFSHLRWNFVFQRPQHLLSRCARDRRVFFVEEPHYDATTPVLQVDRDRSGVTVVVPHLLPDLSSERTTAQLRVLLDRYLTTHRIREYVLWYYTPMALAFSRQLRPQAVVYDCMDELSAFAGAPAGLRDAERELMNRADLVLTGGVSLYESKRRLHPNVHAFPSSVDVPHFAQARARRRDPSDQAPIGEPRLGFFGVVDERFDVPLLAEVAAARPDWQFVIIGPVVKIDPATLPRPANIHYLGQKSYDELPSYIGGWDVALLPFARNASTRFISPTKTPEYLAAGRPVVSTSIRDVVRPYGEMGLVRIADTPQEFAAAVEAALGEDAAARQAAADAFLSGMSWDATWSRINQLLQTVAAVPRASDVREVTAAATPPVGPLTA
jgi:UDP-galactopyranose mutase